MTTIFDDRPCLLGEGPLWHPEREQLYWFDILNRKLMSRTAAGPTERRFNELCSAAGWIDRDRLLIASETSLSAVDLNTGASERLVPLEADNPGTRSNDGRADPWGGFWIGTMGKKAETGAGSIYRYYRGEVRRLFPGISIPNAISFTPDRRFAHFADTATQKIWRVALGAEDGWPTGDASVHIDIPAKDGGPDGAVCDAAGNLWVALWGGSRVACFDPQGKLLKSVTVGGRHASCPAFGGADLATLFVTTARENISPDVIAAEPANGCTFMTDPDATGLPEYRVTI